MDELSMEDVRYRLGLAKRHRRGWISWRKGIYGRFTEKETPLVRRRKKGTKE